MSLDTRTERRQARQRRNLVIGAVVGLASVLSAALVGVLLVVGPGEPPSAARPAGPASSDWSGAGDDVWSDAAPPTSLDPSTAPVTTAATGTPAVRASSSEPAATSASPVTSTSPAPRRTAVTVVRTAPAPPPPAPVSPTPKPAASTSTTTDVPPGQLKRPKPKTPPPPRR